MKSQLLAINNNPIANSANPNKFIVFQDFLYFSADNGQNGSELWRVSLTQETPPELFIDLNPSGNANIQSLTVANNKLYFTANNGTNGIQIYKNDGTKGQATRVSPSVSFDNNSNAGAYNLAANASGLVLINNKLFFFANTPIGPRTPKIYSIDTVNNDSVTIEVPELPAGISNINNLTNVQGILHFTATTQNHGEELFAIDVNIIKPYDLVVGSGAGKNSNPNNLVVVNNILYFLADNNGDGDATGIRLYQKTAKGNPQIVAAYPNLDVVAGSKLISVEVGLETRLYFVGNDGVNGQELYQFEPNNSTTPKQITNLPDSVNLNNLTVANGLIYFTDAGKQLYRLDPQNGQINSISPLKDGNNADVANPGIRDLTVAGNTLYLVANDTVTGEELYQLDISNPNGKLELIDNLNPNPVNPNPPGANAITNNAQNLFNANGTLFFTADDKTNGIELWKLSMAINNPDLKLVKDLKTGAGASSISNSNAEFVFDSFNKTLYFIANNGQTGNELFKLNVNGANSQPELVKDLNGTANDSNPTNLLTIGNGNLYFAALNNGSYRGWQTDGTSVTTVLVPDVINFILSTQPKSAIYDRGIFYFAGDEGKGRGFELYKFNTDPNLTNAQVEAFSNEIFNGLGNPNIRNITALGNTIYFIADTANTTGELFQTFGNQLLFVKPGVQNVSNLMQIGNNIYFTGQQDPNGSGVGSLWQISGDNIVQVSTTSSLNIDNGQGLLAKSSDGKALFFVANDGTHGKELYKLDLTQNNATPLLIDLNKTVGLGSFPEELTLVGDNLYFSATDGNTGFELWKINTKDANPTPVLVKDIFPGVQSSDPYNLTNVYGNLYFTANDGQSGRELWKTDGTTAGTTLVEDLWTGIGDANPSFLTVAENKLFFVANDGQIGNELYALSVDNPSFISPDPGSTLETAYNIGSIKGLRTFQQQINQSDTLDYYKFSVGANDSLSIILKNLSDGASLALIQDKDNDLIIDNDETLYTNSSANGDTIKSAPISLAEGTYYVKVGQNDSEDRTDYTLQLRWPTVIGSFDIKLEDFLKNPLDYMKYIRDFDGNDLGNDRTWKSIGKIDVQGDGDIEYVFVNPVNGRWATVGYDSLTGLVDFSNHSWGGDTRIVGIYEDPLVKSGEVEKNGPFDSQRRFQNDLFIDNLTLIENSAMDYDKNGLQEIYFKVNDGTAVLHAYMHADGNIQYANYQSKDDLIQFMNTSGVDSSFYSGWI